jgi:formylglycine-generating enzyme required for sulfatase activity
MMIRTGCTVWFLSLWLGLSCLGVANAGILPKDGEAQYELEFWESIKNSTHAEDYQAYLKAYPNGRFAPLAKARAARYAKSGSAAVKPAPTSPPAPAPLAKPEPAAVKPAPTSPPAPAPVAKPEPPVVKPAPTSVVARQTGGSASDCAGCPEMVVLQPGSFVMGDAQGDRSEKPAHRVTLRKPFAIGKYEVTLAQWNACVQAAACKAIPDASGWSDESPARNLSWTDAQQYVRWLSKRTGQHYRLPTEAEWEYATRAGTSTRYWWGEKMEPGKANCKGCGGDWNNAAPVSVNAFPPNPFGIYGMNGGVWEWVEDCWHKDYDGAPTDGSAWTSSDCRENVIRGGGWRNDSTYAHSASRFTYDTTVRYILNGFRVAKTLP